VCTVPNRLLLDRAVTADERRWPEVRVQLSLPGVAPERAREALREATRLSPWVAPGALPELAVDPTEATRWTVRVRLLEGGYADRFAGAFPEHVREVLSAAAAAPTAPASRTPRT
jgi:hypothetical protein